MDWTTRIQVAVAWADIIICHIGRCLGIMVISVLIATPLAVWLTDIAEHLFRRRRDGH